MAQDDARLGRILGRVLQVGVTIAAVVTALGGFLLVFSGEGRDLSYSAFTAGEGSFRLFQGGIGVGHLSMASALIQAGLLILILTPVFRVVASLVGFAIERDWLYVVLTLVVLSVLASSLAPLVF